MLKNKTKIIAFFLIVLMLLSLTTVFADNEETTAISEDSLTEEIEKNIENAASTTQLQEDTYKKSDVYLAEKDVTIDYIIDGNLFVCAETVTINSQIGGDAFIIAKNLIIEEEGYIFSNLFAISDSIEIKGVVYDAYSCSQYLTISNGYVYRDLRAVCETLNINGAIGRNAFVDCSNINFNTDEDSNGVIYGDLNYSSHSETDIPENAVNGDINYTLAITSPEKSISSIIASYILNLGKFLVFLVIIWLICLWLAPKFLSNTNQYVGNKTLNALGIGLLALILIPVASIILILLKLTSGVSAVLFGLYILALVVAKSLFTITANNYVCSKLNINKNSGIFGMLILSGIVIWILTKVPYIGVVISFISKVIGLGILVCSIIPKKASKNDTVEVSKEEK